MTRRKRVSLAAIISLWLAACAGSPAAPCQFDIVTAPFEPAGHELTFDPDGDVLTEIDGAPYSGTDGHVPSHQLRSIHLLVAEGRFAVPSGGTSDLFEPHQGGTCTMGCSFICDPSAPVLAISGGDGAGAYQAVFVFSPDGLAVTRQLAQFPDPDEPTVLRLKTTTETR